MTTSFRFSAASVRLIAAGIAVAGIVAMISPGLAHAATYTYAYVNTAGEVNAVAASDWQTAIATASNIHPHSGVLLLTSQNSDIVGTKI